MKIIYTINGREASWCVQERDKYELQRTMNDGIGIPADPMLDVLVFAAYMGEYNTFYRFYRDFVEEFLDPDELFNTEPIEYFNTVISPLLDEDIKILDIEWDMAENKKENKMNKLRRLREAFEDASFDIADRFVAQARKVVNNIADNISDIYADEEMSPHQEAWLDEVVDSFKILKANASKLRDGSIDPCQFLDYIERFMAVTEDEDATDDYLALWPIRKMFTSSYGLEDSKYACCEAARSKTKVRETKGREMEEKYFRFAVSDDSDTPWGYAVGGGEFITSDSEDITLNAIKKVDVKTATTTLVNWLRHCDIEADYDYVARAVSRAFDKGQYDMEFDTWWEGYYEEYSKCTLEATDNPSTDWEDFEDDFSEDIDAANDYE